MTGPITVKPDPSSPVNFCGNYTRDQFNSILVNDSTRPNQDQVLNPRLQPRGEIGKFHINRKGVVGQRDKNSQRCVDCHDRRSNIRPLSIGTSVVDPINNLPTWAQEVELHNHMPPGTNVSPAEWNKAKSLLLSEQQEAIKKWVLKNKCEDESQTKDSIPGRYIKKFQHILQPTDY